MGNKTLRFAIISFLAFIFVILAIFTTDSLVKYANAKINSAGGLVYNFIDFLAPIYMLQYELLFISLFCLSISLWRTYKNRSQVFTKKNFTSITVVIALISTIATCLLGVGVGIDWLGKIFRNTACIKSVYEHSTSPDGRYSAEVVMVDCGAASRIHRSVQITRIPFGLLPIQAIYFNDTPSLRLEWQGRMLIVHGDRTLESMKNKPPTYSHIAGVIFHYMDDFTKN
jgi:hypothetical protein